VRQFNLTTSNDTNGGDCAMNIENPLNHENIQYITKSFFESPILFVTGSKAFTPQRLKIVSNGKMTMRFLTRSLTKSWKISAGFAFKKAITDASLRREPFFSKVQLILVIIEIVYHTKI